MIIKKQSCTILTFFLLLSQTGIAFTVHFCDAKIASISVQSAVNANKTEKNCCGVAEKESKCCHNKIIKSGEKPETIDVISFHFQSKFTTIACNWTPTFFTSKVSSKKINLNSYYCNSNAPPLFKLNCQLVFYA